MRTFLNGKEDEMAHALISFGIGWLLKQAVVSTYNYFYDQSQYEYLN